MRNNGSVLASRRWRRVAMLLLFAMTVLAPIGCASTKPRKHWWQFWRPKATDMSTYRPDQVVLPPPPGSLPGESQGRSGSMGAEGATLAEPEPIRAETRGQVRELQTVHFAYDSDELSPEDQNILRMNYQWIQAHPNYEIQLEGHCDERGTPEYNLNLGDRRAKRVKAYLESLGADPGKLHTISYGKERPLDPGHSEEAWARNRRVQFLVY